MVLVNENQVMNPQGARIVRYYLEVNSRYVRKETPKRIVKVVQGNKAFKWGGVQLSTLCRGEEHFIICQNVYKLFLKTKPCHNTGLYT